LTIAILVLLVGCSDDKLKAENEQLRQQLAEYQTAIVQKQADARGRREAELAYFEGQAGIAAGCDWLIAVCPASITDSGHQAQKDGFAGGESGWFWVIALGKLLALAAVLGAALGSTAPAAARVWYRYTAPAREAAAAARRDIETAEACVAAAKQAAMQAESEELHARANLQVARRQMSDLQDELQSTQNALQEAQTELEEVRAVRAALDGF